METLSLRVERHVANAQAVAQYLADHDEWRRSPTPGCEPVARAGKNSPKGGGAVLAFELTGGVEAGKAFIDALKLHSTWPTSATSGRW